MNIRLQKILLLSVSVWLIFITHKATAQSKSDNGWHLMAPADLAERIHSGSQLPIILDVGPAGLIRGAVAAGPAHESGGITRLREYLSGVSPDSAVIIYCGCCPLDICPNIRPAFLLLQQMGFRKVEVLDLAHNLKVDWIDKGYPQ